MLKIFKKPCQNQEKKQQDDDDCCIAQNVSNLRFYTQNSLKKKHHSVHTSERGRSMVEILGVLAVIGVLSIGGIAGYRYAITKYRANDIVYEVNMRASDINLRYQAIQIPEDITFDEWSETTLQTNFPVFIDKVPEYDIIQIEVSDVPTDVCKEVMKEAPYLAEENNIKFVNVALGDLIGEADLCETEPENFKTLIFTSVINDTDEIGECTLDSHCSNACGEAVCDYANGYTCTSPCEANEVCNEETQTCEAIQSCIEGQEFRSLQGACISCAARGNYEISSLDEPYINEELGIEDTSSPISQCEQCPARAISDTNGRTYCISACLVGRGYVPLTGITNGDSWTQYSENDYLAGCVSCDNPNDYAINSNSAEALAGCAGCGHETYWSGIYLDSMICGPASCNENQFKHFPHLNGSGHKGAICISCDDPSPRYISKVAKFKTMCESCGRTVAGPWCVPEICDDDEFMSASYPAVQNQRIRLGACRSCTDKKSYELGQYTTSTNSSTGETTYSMNDALQYFINQCESCNDTNGDGIISEAEKNSVRKVERDPNGYVYCVHSSLGECNGVLGTNGTCYSCEELATQKKIPIVSEEISGCTRNCPTQAWIIPDNADAGNKLVCYQKCKDDEFQDYYGNCYSCSKEGSAWHYAVPALKQKCAACPETAPRVTLKQNCYKKTICEAGESVYEPESNTCTSCETTSSFYTTDPDACIACKPTKTNQGRYIWYDGGNPICAPIIEDVSGVCNSLSATEMGLTYNGTNGMFFQSKNSKHCYSCSTPSDVESTIDQCRTCGDQRQYDGGKCIIYNGCNGGSTFWGVDQHTCVECNVSEIKTETTFMERHLCDDCSNKRSMTAKFDDKVEAYCVQKCVLENLWQDINGNCYNCSDTTEREIGTDETSRRLCTDCNRELKPILDADDVLIGYKCAPSNN